jgi:fused signal recognition particle receptor
MANSFFSKLKQGLSKTRDNISQSFNNVFTGFSSIDEDFYEELEETLIMGDIGINATSKIMDELREQVKQQHIKEPEKCRELLIQDIRDQMKTDEHAYDFEDKKSVIFVIGVNGVGKTTSVGKLASIFRNKGKKVLIAAADTYRAAATEQLREWADRAQVPLIAGRDGADPASVIFDAVGAFKARDCDILIVDTAGRLHNKKNLMEELAKMNRIIDKELEGIWRENFIVLDGTTGQNALNQAREFGEAASLTGIVLTKLDGTAKGGIAVAIVSELNIPVKYIGVGEGIDDLERFNSDDFVNALMDVEVE